MSLNKRATAMKKAFVCHKRRSGREKFEPLPENIGMDHRCIVVVEVFSSIYVGVEVRLVREVYVPPCR